VERDPPEGRPCREGREVEEKPGQDLLIYGSGELVNALHPHGLIDEYWLMVFPVTLGGGKRLFREGTDMTALTLTDAQMTSSGVALLTYRQAGEPPHSAER
jgi:dihydrofolate reductase